MANYRSPFGFPPDEHMRLLGIIAAHWELLDVVIQRLLAEIMNHDHNRVALLMENMSFRARMELLMAYVREVKPTHPNVWLEYTKLDEQVRGAYGLRNKYVHARWKRGETADVPLRVVARFQGGKLRIADEPTPIEDMEAAAQALWDIGEKFTAFFQGVGMLQQA
jgi:hypothetical protein